VLIEIKNKLQKRVGLSLVQLAQTGNAKNQILPDAPLPLYSNVKGLWKDGINFDAVFYETDTPVYTIEETTPVEEGKGASEIVEQKLYNGLILQTYVDVKQKFTDSNPSYFTRTWDGGTEFTVDDKLLSSVPYKPKEEQSVNVLGEDTYSDYKKYFLRTQGKISVDDFNKFYRAPAGALTDVANTATDFLENTENATEEDIELQQSIQDMYDNLRNNKPSEFFEKASVGVRLCLVFDDSDPLAKQFQTLFNECLFNFNLSPKLSASQYFKQIKFLFDEKVFSYKESGAYAQGTKIVIPIFYKEHDFLKEYVDKYKTGTNWLPLLMDDLYNTAVTLNEGGENDAFGIKKHLNDRVDEFINPKMFTSLIPLSMKHYFEVVYGTNLRKMFDPTIREIVGQILISKAAMDGDWKFDLALSTESAFSGNDGTKDGSGSELGRDDAGYLLLALSILPTIIQAGATYSDPTWRTPWFFPGPQTPLGYLAKIFSPL